jgi:hypothetical protein
MAWWQNGAVGVEIAIANKPANVAFWCMVEYSANGSGNIREAVIEPDSSK